MAVQKFVKKTVRLLELERQAEIEETRLLQDQVSPKELQRRGVCLLKLGVVEQSVGLYGRSLLTLRPGHAGGARELPSHTFTPGDIVGLTLSSEARPGAPQLSGVVSYVTTAAISVAFDESVDVLSLDGDALYNVVKLANDVTYKRLKRALKDLETYEHTCSCHLIQVLFGEAELSSPLTQLTFPGATSDVIDWCNPSLNESQREAVQFALRQREVAVIHGPPGTGKTTAVVEIIAQAVRQKLKVLATAPSNVAVDNLVERLAGYGVHAVRLGHPARLQEGIKHFSLDALLAGSDGARIVQDVRKDMTKTLSQMKRCRGKAGEYQALRQEMKHLRRELREREEKASLEILGGADVVLATNTGATPDGPLRLLPRKHFDLVVIDECAQALEVSCWIPLQYAGRCVLAGDHLQLPPTIISHKAAAQGLNVSLMERVISLHGDQVVRMLTTQYRMHQDIMAWPSAQLYQGKLVAHQSVASHLLCDLAPVEENEDTSLPLLLLDTTGCDLWEMDVPSDQSKGNKGEADLTRTHVERLINSGVCQEDIAVISPYNLQVELLRQHLSSKYPRLEIKSIDGFQGREKEAVVISLVRSNENREVGFLAEDRRINVAITRARRHLAVICDSETVSHHKFLSSLMDYMSTHGEVRSAHQYRNEVVSVVDYVSTHEEVRSAHQYKNGECSELHVHGEVSHYSVVGYISTHGEVRSSECSGLHVYISTHGEVRSVQQYSNESEVTVSADYSKVPVNVTRKQASKETSGSAQTTENNKATEKADVAAEAKKEQQPSAEVRQLEKKETSDESKTDPHLQKQQVINSTQKSNDPNVDLEQDGSHQTCDDTIGGAKPKRKRNRNRNKNKTSQENNTDNNTASDQKQTITTAKEEIETPTPDFATCEHCGKNLPKANLELHTMHCQRVAELKGKLHTASAPKEKPHTAQKNSSSRQENKRRPKSGKKKQGGKNMLDDKEDENDDLDALLARVVKEDHSCHYERCKNSVATVGQFCVHCRKLYCLSHHMPEVHGCGADAHMEARAKLSKDTIVEGKLYAGSKKKLKPEQRAYLQRKLDKKLTDMEEKRQPKRPTEK
ncbi:PREDICTED: DNA-binding protein SMUBP-2-like [Branchiostoma belcheri]|uniref:DNA helicase n=1 Tax=Branchiostoma belcheri TaxID=7741 RepID=A0A6P4ZNU5_BRABE|nr:PREDICTED: DNA-binding protein SMUBP-2-like [Branchiostoma belcheri]